MIYHRTEEEVDAMIEDMKTRTKGKYITQGVSFNKSCPRQMGLLKKALLSSASFSGLVKEALAIMFNDGFNPKQGMSQNYIHKEENLPDSIPYSKIDKSNANKFL